MAYKPGEHPDTLQLLDIYQERLDQAQAAFDAAPSLDTFQDLKYYRRKVTDFQAKAAARASRPRSGA
jgi:hypothetical protein